MGLVNKKSKKVLKKIATFNYPTKQMLGFHIFAFTPYTYVTVKYPLLEAHK